MILKPDLDAGYARSVQRDADADPVLRHRRARRPASSTPATRARPPSAPRPISRRPASATPSMSAPRPSSSCSTTSASRTATTARCFTDRRHRAADQHRPANMSRQSRPPSARQGRLFPGRAGRQRHGHPRRDGLDDDRDGPADGQAPSRGRRRPARARPDLRHAGPDRRPHADLQICRAHGRPGLRQDRDLHAQADQGGQRLGHAHPHVDLEGRQAAVRRQRLCRPVARPASISSAA